MSKEEFESQNMKRESKSKDINGKKDHIYVTVILFIIFGVLFVWKWDGETQLTNQISLITSWISISLAFLAILYAFFQTYVTREDNEKVASSIEKFESEINKVRELGEVVKEIKEMSENTNRRTKAMADDFKGSLEGANIISSESLKKMIENNKDKEPKDLANEIVTFISNSDDKFVDDYLDAVNNNKPSGYSQIVYYIQNIVGVEEFTPSDIGKHFKEKGVNLTPGQIAGALSRLKNDGIIESVTWGVYRKKYNIRLDQPEDND
ncbi:hypothetical protein H7992_14395 [Sporosarcina sp. resist]|uniref:hypothetical protein n=1 Tax=Sporosarcina sp. resist TaxID=2762563 RepID=UPI00164DC25A|nr:hypothetical protein [Sporosarcina sp. resist]QNK86449.1 hypothetical protein H7992_14395 [Sporosarcina sp. resist]